MYLVNQKTGQRILLAKHFATEWKATPDLEGQLDRAFDAEMYEFLAIQGSTAWHIEYESSQVEAGDVTRGR